MDSPKSTPAYYNLILLIVFTILFFYFLYELAIQGSTIMDGVIMLVSGAFAIRNYVKWKEKLRKPIQ